MTDSALELRKGGEGGAGGGGGLVLPALLAFLPSVISSFGGGRGRWRAAPLALPLVSAKQIHVYIQP